MATTKSFQNAFISVIFHLWYITNHKAGFSTEYFSNGDYGYYAKDVFCLASDFPCLFTDHR